MLEERELPQVSRGDSRTSGAGLAGTGSVDVVSSPEASATGSFGSRSARKRHGLFHRTGIALPAGGLALLLVVVVWGAVKVMDPQGAGANSLFQSIDGLGTSSQASALTQEYDTLLEMTAASKTLTVAAVPAHTDPDEIMDQSSGGTMADESGGTSVATLAAPADPSAAQQTAQQIMPSFGFSVASQWSCLYSLWEQESTWNVYAENAVSGAYGIPQSLPGDKMASAGADWQTDAATQIKWGLGYISQVYGTPCAAWDHEEADGFY
jgi:hypothetical protein